MQQLKLAEIKDLSVPEVQEQLKKSRLDLVTLRMKFASRQLEDVSLMKKKRKEIARLLTLLTKKRLTEVLKPEDKIHEKRNREAKKQRSKETEKQRRRGTKRKKEEKKSEV